MQNIAAICCAVWESTLPVTIKYSERLTYLKVLICVLKKHIWKTNLVCEEMFDKMVFICVYVLSCQWVVHALSIIGC